MRPALFAISLTLVSCAGIEPHKFVGPNGNTAYSMRCSGMGRTLGACYEKAGEICPGGYNIVDRSAGTVGMPTGGGTLIAPRESLAVECK